MSAPAIQPGSAVKFISFDQDWQAAALHQIPSYLAGNQRILAHQGADGALWALSAQVASLAGRSQGAPLEDSDTLYFCNGIQGRGGPVCWYEMELANGRTVNTSEPSYRHETGYYLGVIPCTFLGIGSLQVTISTLSPVRQHDRGYTERPTAVLYQLQVANKGTRTEAGQLRLRIRGEVYVVCGGALQWRTPPQSLRGEDGRLMVVLESEDLPDIVLSSEEPATAEVQPQPALATRFAVAPGETWCFHAWVVFGTATGARENSSRNTLQGALAEQWMASTVEYWGKRLGAVSVHPPTRVSDFLTRAAQECLYCIRVNDVGEVVGVVSSPVPVAERPEFSDILFVCMPALYLEPELYGRVIAWYAERYAARAQECLLDTQARVIPAIMAGLLLRTAGSMASLSDQPQAVAGIEQLLESVVERRETSTGLFPTDLMHGYQPLIKYELGTNIQCWAAFHWWTQVLDYLDMRERAARWRVLAAETRESIRRSFAITGPGKGGWHYGGLRLVADYRLDPLHFYEHDALDIAIAPVLGFCSDRHRPWLNTMQHLFSPYYQLVTSRSTTAVWWEPANVGLRREKHSYPSVVARLASVQDSEELDRALLALERAIDVNGVLWLRSARGLERMMRSGREMGAAYALLVQRILGMHIDSARKLINYTPRNPWRASGYQTEVAGAGSISAWNAQGRGRAQSVLINGTDIAWEVHVGFRFPRAFEVMRVWLDGRLDEHEVTVEEYDGGPVFRVACDLPAGGQVAVAIEATRRPPPGFSEAASVA